MGKIVQIPWVTNVLKRLLDVRGSEIPGGFAHDVAAIFDVSRRYPEVLREAGIVPWQLLATSPLVAGEFSFIVLNVSQQNRVIVLLGVRNASLTTQLQLSMHSAVPTLTAPGSLGVFARDQRLGTAGVDVGLTVQFDSEAVIPGNQMWQGLVNTGGVINQLADNPMVLVQQPVTGNRVVFYNNTVAQAMQLDLWGYSLPIFD